MIQILAWTAAILLAVGLCLWAAIRKYPAVKCPACHKQTIVSTWRPKCFWCGMSCSGDRWDE